MMRRNITDNGRFAAAAVAASLLLTSLSGCGMSLPFFETEETAYDAGMTLLESREYKEALTRFAAVESRGENGAELYRGIGIANYRLGNYAEAEEAFAASLSHCGGMPGPLAYDVSYYLAELYGAEGKTAEAIGVYDAILALKPREKDARYLRGLAYLKNGEHEHASEDFASVVAEKPRQYDRILSIYEALSEAGYAMEGRAMLENLLQEDADALNNYERGRISYYLGDLESAKSALEAANSESNLRASDKIPIVILLGEVEQQLGDDSAAISVYRRFLQEDQSQASMYNALGVCEMRMGSYNDALSDFQIGLSLDDPGQNAALLRNMVAAYEYMGNFELAAQRMEEYLELVPTDEDARRENVFLTTRMEGMKGR